jgi:hypothetical protein
MRPLLFSLIVLIPACAYNKPTTELRVNPMTRSVAFTNTKDVDATVEKVAVTWSNDGGSFEIDGFTVSDQASPVIKENVQQMLAFAEQQRAANEGIIGTVRELGGWISELRQMTALLTQLLRGSQIQLDTPIGSGSGTLGTPTTTAPTTQPTETK